MASVIDALQTNAYQHGMRYDLIPFKAKLAIMGHPEKKLPPSLHIAGTHGKGSTVAFLYAGLRALGYRVGTFTSPHIETYMERIQINGIPITETQLTALYDQIPDHTTLTEFETLTLIACLYFIANPPDIVIFETGLGGRLDATNVIHPQLSGLTPIDWDHMSVLGHSIHAIATEKAGIIKPTIPVITVPQSPDAHAVIAKTAAQQHAPLHIATPLDDVSSFRLFADVQRTNAGLAYAMIRHLKPQVETQHLLASFATATHWGRYTHHRTATQTRIIDAAHNVGSLTMLLSQLAHQDPDFDKKAVFVMGLLQRKPYHDMLALIPNHIPIRLVDFQPGSSVGPHNTLPRPVTFMDRHHPDLLTGPFVVITGSIYFLGALKSIT